MVDFINSMASKISQFKNPRGYGRDLRILAEGAEEMRILGSILGINKGLKSSVADAETFIDNIENLIYDRIKVLGGKPTEADRIDFHRFMLDSKYQRAKIDAYEKVKHSVNILHLISRVPHFNAYLKTELIPTTFFTAQSIKYRTLHKYRKNIYADYTEAQFFDEFKGRMGSGNPYDYIDKHGHLSLFNLFEVEGSKEKEQILRGLENLIQFKLFTRWAHSKNLKFKVPKGFVYFTEKGDVTSNQDEEIPINLSTEVGLATFKKYMEEVYIPSLRDDVDLARTNTFVKNLTKISYTKTPVHSSVITYSLQGDLMAKEGRLGELNARMFADFQHLAHIPFQPESGIPSAIDAFYIYAQYCYMGRKGKRSLMSLFDSDAVRSPLIKSFEEFVAGMDDNGDITCSKEELIVWCAPTGNQKMRSKYGYVASKYTSGISLKQKINDNVRLTDEQAEALQEAMEQNMDENEER